jgi:hypothetical protein
MDQFPTGGVIDGREIRFEHNKTDKGDKETSENEGSIHLTIDTSVVNRSSYRSVRTPLLTSANYDHSDTLTAITESDDNGKTIAASYYDLPSRMRAMSESERSLFNSGTGIRIPQKPATHLYSLLTPPPSYSPASIDSDNPYSTSAHLYPADSAPDIFPDSPQSLASRRGRGPSQLRSSLYPMHRAPRSAHSRSPTDGSGVGVARSASYSFGGHSQQPTYVDASSYDSVPDSPAKQVPSMRNNVADRE